MCWFGNGMLDSQVVSCVVKLQAARFAGGVAKRIVTLVVQTLGYQCM